MHCLGTIRIKIRLRMWVFFLRHRRLCFWFIKSIRLHYKKLPQNRAQIVWPVKWNNNNKKRSQLNKEFYYNYLKNNCILNVTLIYDDSCDLLQFALLKMALYQAMLVENSKLWEKLCSLFPSLLELPNTMISYFENRNYKSPIILTFTIHSQYTVY